MRIKLEGINNEMARVDELKIKTVKGLLCDYNHTHLLQCMDEVRADVKNKISSKDEKGMRALLLERNLSSSSVDLIYRLNQFLSIYTALYAIRDGQTRLMKFENEHLMFRLNGWVLVCDLEYTDSSTLFKRKGKKWEVWEWQYPRTSLQEENIQKILGELNE